MCAKKYILSDGRMYFYTLMAGQSSISRRTLK